MATFNSDLFKRFMEGKVPTAQGAANNLMAAGGMTPPTGQVQQVAPSMLQPTGGGQVQPRIDPMSLSEPQAQSELQRRGVGTFTGADGAFVGTRGPVPSDVTIGNIPDASAELAQGTGLSTPQFRGLSPTAQQAIQPQITAPDSITRQVGEGSVSVPQSLAAPTFNAPRSMSIAETQAELQRRFGAPTVSGNMNPPSMGLETDAQGRMIDPTADRSSFEQASLERQQAIGGTGSFAGDSAAREARLAERSDFGAAISDRERRGAGEMSMEAATRMTGGNREAARAMIERQRQGIGEFAEPTDDRTPEEIEADRLDVERKRQIVEQGKQPDATPEQKKASARQQAVEAGTITQAQADEANKRDLIGNPPAGYDTWAQYESETGTDADGDGKVATQQEAAQASASPKINAAQLSGQDRAAYEWAQANPDDPRSAKILERLSK